LTNCDVIPVDVEKLQGKLELIRAMALVLLPKDIDQISILK
jgi:hypothetical protein